MYGFTKALSALVFSPALVVLLIATALVLLAMGRHRAAAGLLAVTAAALYALSITPVTDALVTPLEEPFPYPAPEELACDAIVVAGGGLVHRSMPADGSPDLSPASAERVSAAYRLWRQLDRPILLSGGAPWDFDLAEATVMAEAMTALGVPESALVLEWWSRNTYENAQRSKEVTEAFGWRSLCLVTSAFHLPRAVRAFREAGLTVVPVPAGGWASGGGYDWASFVPALNQLHASTLALREYVALVWYRWWYGV